LHRVEIERLGRRGEGFELVLEIEARADRVRVFGNRLVLQRQSRLRQRQRQRESQALP
jgi:hypothetical protein